MEPTQPELESLAHLEDSSRRVPARAKDTEKGGDIISVSICNHPKPQTLAELTRYNVLGNGRSIRRPSLGTQELGTHKKMDDNAPPVGLCILAAPL